MANLVRRDHPTAAALGAVETFETPQSIHEAPSCATVAGVRIDGLDFDAVVDAIIARALNGTQPSVVVTPNAHHVVLLQDDVLLREVYQNAYLVVPDGVPLQWAARLLGERLGGRVNGTDLFEALCAQAAQCDLGIFLLGGREGAADGAAECLKARNPSLRICGTYCPPFGFENDAVENRKILTSIESAKPQLLFVGLGAPKQEYWMHQHAKQLSVPVSVGVGISFEFVAGIVARAPRWMQRTGLEWLFRLGTEPLRLWKRYVFGNARFCMLVSRQFATQRIAQRSWPRS